MAQESDQLTQNIGQNVDNLGAAQPCDMAVIKGFTSPVPVPSNMYPCREPVTPPPGSSKEGMVKGRGNNMLPCKMQPY